MHKDTETTASLVQLQTASMDELQKLSDITQEISSELSAIVSRGLSDEPLQTYAILNSDGTKTIGFAQIIPYTKDKHCKEIVIKLDEADETTADKYADALSQIISANDLDSQVNYYIFKVEENNELLQQAAERTGFLQEGLFISNQNSHDGEFVFYSIYKYKLI